MVIASKYQGLLGEIIKPPNISDNSLNSEVNYSNNS